MQYFFILGRNPELSLAELHALLPEKYTLTAFSREVTIVECRTLDAETLMRRLGGTIKMGEMFPTRHFDRVTSERDEWRNLTPNLLQVVRSLDAARDDAGRQKLFLGLSAYALDTCTRLPNVRELRELGIVIKRALQEQGYKVRLVTSKEITLSSVIVKREKLLTQGAEIILLYTKDGISFGKTLAVQEFAEASARDFGRPERSMGVGMLPIQLTKVMLNLAKAPKDAVLLDPFCGLGTVLTEASQMGYKNLIGTDREQPMIDATRKNLQWLTDKVRVAHDNTLQNKLLSYSRELETNKITLLATAVENLSSHITPHSVDAIVTEPYLGPTRGQSEINTLISQLSTLYIAAFREFAKVLKPGGRVVFILPAFKHGVQLTKTSDRVLPEIKKLGFSPTPLFPDNLRTHLPAYPLTSILYSRPDQRVLREIFVLEFKK